ncbi:MAG: LytTR family DNA-binding domain-containing protein [Tissierellaceae bacterium]
MIRSIIVDDEMPARQELRYILSRYKDIEVVGEASNGIEALLLNENLSPDLMFLDIKMPQMSRIELAKILLEKERPPMIIFVTAYDKFALQAFEVNAVDYLLKPIDEGNLRDRLESKILSNERNEIAGHEDIKALINYIEDKRKPTINRMTVYHNGRMIPIESKDIIYVTVEDRNTIIITKKGRFILNSTLGELMDKLDSSLFFRTHKSFIVNLDAIESIEPWFNSTLNIRLKNLQDIVPVSRNYSKDFKKIMNID